MHALRHGPSECLLNVSCTLNLLSVSRGRFEPDTKSQFKGACLRWGFLLKMQTKQLLFTEAELWRRMLLEFFFFFVFMYSFIRILQQNFFHICMKKVFLLRMFSKSKACVWHEYKKKHLGSYENCRQLENKIPPPTK